MKNKIILILSIMLFLISTSCLAVTADDFKADLVSGIEELTGETYTSTLTFSDVFENLLNSGNVQNYYIYLSNAESSVNVNFAFNVKYNDSLPFESWYSLEENGNIFNDIPISQYESTTAYRMRGRNTSGSYTIFKNINTNNFPESGSLTNTNYYKVASYNVNYPDYTSGFVYCPTGLGEENWTYRSTLPVRSLTDGSVLLKANSGTSQKLPVLGSLNDIYTEKDSSIELTVYNNNSDLNHYVVVKRYLVSNNEIDSNFSVSINYSKLDNYYNSDTDSWVLPLENFCKFEFSNDYYYLIELRVPSLDEPIIDTAGPFKVQFSDEFNPDAGDSYDITPIIAYYPLSASVQKSVTISSPVSGVDIYYKLSTQSAWQLYTGPFVVNENCIIYAVIYGVDGSSATAQLEIKNIVSQGFENRPGSGPLVSVLKNKSGGFFDVTFWVEAAENLDIEYSTDGSFWNNYIAIAKYSSIWNNPVNVDFDAYKTTLSLPLPKTVYFRYVDSNGFYSPITKVFLSASDSGMLPEKFNAGNVDLYDENGNFILDMNNKDNSSFDISEILGENGKIDYDNIISSGLDMGWSIITHFGDFFVLLQGLFIFIPKDIMLIIIGLLVIKFIIALIGFLRG